MPALVKFLFVVLGVYVAILVLIILEYFYNLYRNTFRRF